MLIELVCTRLDRIESIYIETLTRRHLINLHLIELNRQNKSRYIQILEYVAVFRKTNSLLPEQPRRAQPGFFVCSQRSVSRIYCSIRKQQEVAKE